MVSAFSGVGLVWDGAYQLFNVLDTQQLVVPYGRMTKMLLFWLPLQVSQRTDNFYWLSLAYSLAHLVLPWLALVAAWLIVRRNKNARLLFVWTALVWGVGTLPGQICSVCESLMSVQLLMPVLMAILVGLPGKTFLIVLFFVTLIIFLHPLAILALLLAFTASLLVALFRPAVRRKMLLWAGLFILLLAFAAMRFYLFHSNYESQQFSLQLFASYLVSALMGLPAWAIGFGWLAGLLLLIQRLSSRKSAHRLFTVFSYAAVGSVMISGLLLALWALTPRLWSQEINFRSLAFFTSMPFIFFAMIEAIGMHDIATSVRLWRVRRVVIALLGFSIAFVVIVQGLTWFQFTQELRRTIESSAQGCISTADLPWLEQTAMNHWALASYSLLLQGRTPKTIVMRDGECADADFADGLPVALFDTRNIDVRNWHAGWFHKEELRAHIETEQPPAPCHFPISQGWDWVERDASGWWRWTADSATILIELDRPVAATLNMELNSTSVPNQIDIQVNGKLLTAVTLQQRGFQAVAPLQVSLQKGANTIRFVSHNPPIVAPPDTRAISIAVKNFQLTAEDSMTLCK